MNTSPTFPKSFPNTTEIAFLRLLFCSDHEFVKLFNVWQKEIVFDRIDYATSRLLPLLYIRLRTLEIKGPFTDKIKGLYKLAWVKNQRLIDALSKMIPELEADGVDVLILKGIPLLLDVYKDVGARFLGDADILIHPRFAKKVLNKLLSTGWKPVSPYFPRLDYFSEHSLPRVVKEGALVNGVHVEVDIHWRLFEPSPERAERVPFDVLWQRSRPINYKEKTYRTISPEDMLIHVIIHGAEGNIHRTLRWVVDSVAIINAYPINWESVLDYAKQDGWTVELVIAFNFLQTHRFVKIPESFSRALADIPLEKNALRAYYKKSNNTHAWWGSFPRLWRTYWQYEVKGIFPVSVYYCVVYMAHAWGFTHVYELLPFIVMKYWQRLGQVFK